MSIQTAYDNPAAIDVGKDFNINKSNQYEEGAMTYYQLEKVRQANSVIVAISNVLIKDMVDADTVVGYRPQSKFQREQLLRGIDLLSTLVEEEFEQ